MSSLDANGLTIDSRNTIVTNLTASLQGIYGADINVNSNSPDGQLIEIFAQNVTDILELLQAVYNSFSFETAYGTQLDQRIAVMGITRLQGTYTQTPVVVTVSQALTLYGLDQTAQSVFTVADTSGNQYQLLTTTAFSGAGNQTLTFQAVSIGQVELTANTVTQKVTNILGVSSVNNPSTTGVLLGQNEETDTQLKIRAARSFALASTGPADAVSAALLTSPGVTDAFVVENVTNGTVNTVPAHSIWCIVTGGTAAGIAQAIYAKKGIGCGMKGSLSLSITRPNGTAFIAQWDASISQPLHIRFTINPRTAGQVFNTALIALQLSQALEYQLGQSPTIGDVVSAMLAIAPTSYQTNLGVSLNGTDYFDVVSPTDAQHYFTVAKANIDINT